MSAPPINSQFSLPTAVGRMAFSTWLRSIGALQGLAPGDNVLFAGSFSKMLFPSLRMGFVVLPSHLVEPMRAARSMAERYGPIIEQAVLGDFIAERHFGQHLRRMREIYAERLDVLTTAAPREWGNRLRLRRRTRGFRPWVGSPGQCAMTANLPVARRLTGSKSLPGQISR